MMMLTTVSAKAQKYAGGDLSMLPKYEAANVQYKDPNGQRINDVLGYLKTEAGFNIVRVRLFVNPTGETGVCQDLEYVKSLGSRVKEKGMKLLLDFRLQCNGNTLIAVEHILGDAVLEISADDMVEDVKTLLQLDFLQTVFREFPDLLIRQVIDEILLCARGLYRKHFLVGIYNDAVGSQHLLPFLIGEIYIGGYQLLIGLGWFCRTWTCLYGWKVGLQIM